MAEMLRSRHMIIASLILGGAILIIAAIAQFSENRLQDGQIMISREQWYTVSNGTLSGSRFGYSSLYYAAKKQFNASVRQLPTYPDEGNISGTSGSEYVICINAPERKWNDRESAALLDFIKRGGTAIIVVPTDSHLLNTASFFEKLGIAFKSQSLNNEPAIRPFLSPYRQISLSISTDYRIPDTSYIRVGSSSTNNVFSDKGLINVYRDQDGKPVVNALSRNDWNGGQIFWICGALPGYNGEAGDPAFKESFIRHLARKYGLNTHMWDSVKERVREKLEEKNEVGLEGAVIPDQKNLKRIRSGINLFEGLVAGDPDSENRRTLIFFDYLKEQSDTTEVLALLSSGALYAVILTAVLVFTGLLFFVRGKPPVNAIREMKSAQRVDPYPPDEIDPQVLRQGRTRFPAQLIHIESELKKLPKER